MTKEQAIEKMKQGVKISHRYFNSHEWMTQRGCIIILEDGVECYAEDFWADRKDAAWNDGYREFVNTKCKT